MARKATKSREEIIDEINKDPEFFETLNSATYTIADIISEIYEKSDLNYTDLHEILGISESHVGKLARHTEKTVKDPVVGRLAKTFNLPFKSLVYHNSLERLKQQKFDDLRAIEEQGNRNNESIPQEHAVYSESIFLDQITVDNQAYNQCRTNNERMELLSHYSVHRYLRWKLPEPSSDHSIYACHKGNHMLDIRRRDTPRYDENLSLPRQIQDGAVVEVALVDEKSLINGDIVFVKIGEEKATCYLYYKHKAASGHFEQYAPINAFTKSEIAPSRLIPYKKERGVEDLMQRRAIIGKVIRIVHYDLTE